MGNWTSRTARVCARHPWRVLGVWAAALVGALAATVLLLGGVLTTDGTFTAERDSKTGFELLDDRLTHQVVTTDEAVVVRSPQLVTNDQAFRTFVAGLADDIEATGATRPVVSYLTAPGSALVSKDQHAALLSVGLLAEDDVETAVKPVLDVVAQADDDAAFDVDVTGPATGASDFVSISEKDLQKGELIGVPAALLILLLVFGALIAGLIPVAMAIVCIPVTFGIAALIGQVWDLSFFLINMVTAMGLALGIDYSLFIVSRYREERRRGLLKEAAIAAAAGTAGTAVLFSGVSFAVALSGLFLVPDTVLRSLAAGAVTVGIVTLVAALTLLPAVLSLLGDRIDRFRVPFVHSAVHEGASSEGRVWTAVVHAVMRRPAAFLGAAVAILALAAVPVLGLTTGTSGLTTLPDDTVSKSGFLALERSFPASGRLDPARVVVDGDPTDARTTAAVAALRSGVEASGRFGATRVSTYPAERLTVLDVPLPGDSASEQAEQAMRDLRSDFVEPAFAGVDAPAYVTGTTAFNVDYAELVSRWLPIVIAFVLGLTFILLTLVFRSVVLPLKAVLLNLLSVGAAYGLLVLVLQHGYGAGALGLTQVDAVEPWVPVFLFSVLFALSMDYHVFLLSRIREAYAESGDTKAAVAYGISSTARLITGAALIIVVVFTGFALGDLVGFQQMGFGVAAALLIDATIVRSVIVPASMSLLGKWNWYLPRWLEWLPELQVEGSHRPAVVVLPDAVPQPREPAEQRSDVNTP
jgi:RND superfamily putative drug exporter